MSIKVLIADDHAVVRDGLRALLEADPQIEVVGGAGDGPSAVAQAAELQPNVVIMDISMPEMDGIRATAEVLKASPCARVIILSMLNTPEHVFRALQAGAAGFLLKESAGRQVVEAVQAAARGELYFSQPVASTLASELVKYRQQAEERCGRGLLSERERQILPLVAAGRSSAEIAAQLYLSPKTVDSYRSRMMRKLGTPDLASLIRYAIQEGLVD